MEELEVAILIVVVLLLLLAVANAVMYWKEDGRNGYVYGGLTHPMSCHCYKCKADNVLEGYESINVDKASSMLTNGSWSEDIQGFGVDDATKNSHVEWRDEILGKTTGSSTHTLIDHDIDSNWRGLGYGNTWRKVYSQPGARVVEGTDWQDNRPHSNLRWRCHEYQDSDEDNTGESCPWPNSGKYD